MNGHERQTVQLTEAVSLLAFTYNVEKFRLPDGREQVAVHLDVPTGQTAKRYSAMFDVEAFARFITTCQAAGSGVEIARGIVEH